MKHLEPLEKRTHWILRRPAVAERCRAINAYLESMRELGRDAASYRRKAKRMFRDCAGRFMVDADELAYRAKLGRTLAKYAEGGRVLIVESGRDCDGASWENRTFEIKAQVAAYIKMRDQKHEWADGPIWFQIDRPSARTRYDYQCRDLALEAFENGHPHIIHA